MVFSSADGWEFYAFAYQKGGDELVEVAKRTPRTADTLIYPILYCYRHYLELRLKSLIRDTSSLLDVPRDPPANHDLRALWSEV